MVREAHRLVAVVPNSHLDPERFGGDVGGPVARDREFLDRVLGDFTGETGFVSLGACPVLRVALRALGTVAAGGCSVIRIITRVVTFVLGRRSATVANTSETDAEASADILLYFF